MFPMIRRQWNPWREFERTFEAFAPNLPRGLRASEDADGITLVAEVPGLGPKDIEVTVLGDEVTLRGKADPPADTKDMRCIRRERPEASFERSYRLPFEIDAEKVDAKVAHGVLTLRLPRTAADKPRQIKVRAA